MFHVDFNIWDFFTLSIIIFRFGNLEIAGMQQTPNSNLTFVKQNLYSN